MPAAPAEICRRPGRSAGYGQKPSAFPLRQSTDATTTIAARRRRYPGRHDRRRRPAARNRPANGKSRGERAGRFRYWGSVWNNAPEVAPQPNRRHHGLIREQNGRLSLTEQGRGRAKDAIVTT